jgi:dihydrofolate reductase
VRASVFIAASLDGFIARPGGAIDWLPPVGGPDGEDYGYTEFFDSVDAMVIGRNSYELVRTFGSWPYGTKPVFVYTRRKIESIPPEARVETVTGTPAEIVEQLSAGGVGHIYVDGGRTVQAFLAAGLIDRLTITRIPVLIGKGIPLFGPVPHDIHLRHLRTRAYPNGLVQSDYEPVKESLE